MQYTMVNSYRTHGALDLTTWVLVREYNDEVEAWTFSAYQFSAVGDAVACIEEGALSGQVECTAVFYADHKLHSRVFVDDMRQPDTGEGPFPHLNWCTI